MCLEIYIYNKSKITLDEIEEEESLPQFPSRGIIIEQIKVLFPESKLNNPSVMQLENEAFKGEIIFGSNDTENNIFYVRIYGGESPVCLVTNLCRTYNWSAYTPENDMIVDLNGDCDKYWKEYLQYRNQIEEIFYKR